MVITTSVLVANEPLAYRDTIAIALRILRPEVKFIATNPELLDALVLQYEPEMVICSHLTTIVETRVPKWVILHPNGAMCALLQIGGERTLIPDIDLEKLAYLISNTGDAFVDLA